MKDDFYEEATRKYYNEILFHLVDTAQKQAVWHLEHGSKVTKYIAIVPWTYYAAWNGGTAKAHGFTESKIRSTAGDIAVHFVDCCNEITVYPLHKESL